MTTMFTLQGWSWGGVGHWTVARIADDLTSRVAENEIKQILHDDETLMSVSTLPDSWRNVAAWRHTYNYHFDTIAVGKSYLEQLQASDQATIALGGVTQAILQSLQILKNRKFNSNPESIREALIFLVHFVGDIHQPLHVGKPGDKGGNNVTINWMGKNTNLHSVWDTSMILTNHKDILHGTETINNSKVYSSYLEKKYQSVTEQPGSFYFEDEEIQNWLVESTQLRDQLYVGFNGNQETYQNKFGELQDLRLFKAGQRLGRILNSLFDNQKSLSLQGKFRQMIEQIVGKIDRIINLSPHSQLQTAVSDLDNPETKN